MSVGRCCRSSSQGGGDHPSGPDPLGTSHPATTVPCSCDSLSPHRDRQVMPCPAWGWGSSSVAPWGRGTPRAQCKRSSELGGMHSCIAARRRPAGGQGAPATAQPVNGSPHPPMLHLTTCLQKTACREPVPGEPPARCQPRLHPAGDPRVPRGGISWPQGRMARAMGHGGTQGTVVLGVTRGQGIHPPAPGEMERAAVPPR